jgi:hypothetical protein
MKKCTLLLALVALLGSCKKDNDNPAPAATDLTTGSWKMSASTAVVEFPAPVGTQTTDLFALLPACDVDNTFKFNTDNSVTIDEGATKCDPNDPQTETDGVWTLSNNNTKFNFDYKGATISGDVLTMNSSTFVLKYVTNVNNIKSTTTTTYVRP